MLGVVTNRHPDNFDVDIGSPFRALLPALAFEGATRRNRPNLQARRGVWGEGLRRGGEAWQ